MRYFELWTNSSSSKINKRRKAEGLWIFETDYYLYTLKVHNQDEIRQAASTRSRGRPKILWGEILTARSGLEECSRKKWQFRVQKNLETGKEKIFLNLMRSSANTLLNPTWKPPSFSFSREAPLILKDTNDQTRWDLNFWSDNRRTFNFDSSLFILQLCFKKLGLTSTIGNDSASTRQYSSFSKYFLMVYFWRYGHRS